MLVDCARAKNHEKHDQHERGTHLPKKGTRHFHKLRVFATRERTALLPPKNVVACSPGLSAQMFDGDDVNLITQMFGPVSHDPIAEAFDLEWPAHLVALDPVAWLRGIANQAGKDTEELFSLSL